MAVDCSMHVPCYQNTTPKLTCPPFCPHKSFALCARGAALRAETRPFQHFAVVCRAASRRLRTIGGRQGNSSTSNYAFGGFRSYHTTAIFAFACTSDRHAYYFQFYFHPKVCLRLRGSFSTKVLAAEVETSRLLKTLLAKSYVLYQHTTMRATCQTYKHTTPNSTQHSCQPV